MLKNISDKDFKLLVFMFLVVVIVGIGYWGVWPQIKAFNNMQEEIEEASAEAELNEAKVMNLGFVTAMASDYEEQIAERKDEFYPIMKSSEVDQMMTNIASQMGLEIYDLRFNMPSDPTQRMAYKYSALYYEQLEQKANYEKNFSKGVTTEEDLLSDLSGEEGEEEEGEKKESGETAETLNIFGTEDGYQPNTDIYAVSVTMTVGGSVENLNRFINRLNSMDKRTLLKGYSWGEYHNVIRRDANGRIISGTEVDEDGVVRKTLTVRIELYMCDTTDIGESAEESAN